MIVDTWALISVSLLVLLSRCKKSTNFKEESIDGQMVGTMDERSDECLGRKGGSLNEPIRGSGESHGRLPGAPLVGVSAKEVSAW